jgi:protein phosphatase
MNLNIITKIKEYLENWIKEGNYPTNFMEMEFSYQNRTQLLKEIISISTLETIVNEVKSSKEIIKGETIIYLLGIYLYKSLTNELYKGELNHIEIKKPRIYQFLNMVLKENPQSRVAEVNYLLSILLQQTRDNIYKRKETSDYRIELFSTIGLTRNQNQDYADYYEGDSFIALIVADGVGGGVNGEVASKLVTEFTIYSLRQHSFVDKKDEEIKEILRDIVFNANREVLDYAQKHKITKIGTTFSMALIVERSNLYIAHVGDSRVYEFDNQEEPRQLTPDHSYPEELFRLGKIKEEEKKDYKKNILVYVLGKDNLKRENIFVQHSYIFDKTDLLLCSDGLWERAGVTKKSFTDSFEKLQIDMFDTVPTDNVSVIRYFAFEQEEEAIKDKIYYDMDTSVPSIEKIVNYPKKFEETKISIIDNIQGKIIKILLGITGFLFIILIFVFLFHDNSNTPSINPNIDKIELFFKAVKERNLTQVKKIIDEKIDINTTNKGYLALHYAYENSDIEMIELLVKNGIDRDEVESRVIRDINRTKREYKKLYNIKKALDNVEN